MDDIKNVTRAVLVDNTGRVYDQYVEKVELSYQDGGRTLKIFVKQSNKGPDMANLEGW